MFRAAKGLLAGTRPLVLDGEGRVRLDTWELNHAVQDAVAERWSVATTDIPWPAAN
ncbi:hypothetical protein ACGFRG_19695 [Streptomyces sp. NPDC048696]|uniref:hypothetical protein n=1 Tax=Streptomyces sp. NPDC048696 TaxID=3365585 RepID=UPI00371DF12D